MNLWKLYFYLSLALESAHTYWIFKLVFLEDMRKVDVQYLWSGRTIDNVNFNVEKKNEIMCNANKKEFL